jgi:hypothetical protein
MRWYAFKGFTSLIDQDAGASSADVNFLKKFKTNKKEDLIFRIKACFGLGRHYYIAFDRESAARAYKSGIARRS